MSYYTPCAFTLVIRLYIRYIQHYLPARRNTFKLDSPLIGTELSFYQYEHFPCDEVEIVRKVTIGFFFTNMYFWLIVFSEN